MSRRLTPRIALPHHLALLLLVRGNYKNISILLGLGMGTEEDAAVVDVTEAEWRVLRTAWVRLEKAFVRTGGSGDLLRNAVTTSFQQEFKRQRLSQFTSYSRFYWATVGPRRVLHEELIDFATTTHFFLGMTWLFFILALSLRTIARLMWGI